MQLYTFRLLIPVISYAAIHVSAVDTNNQLGKSTYSAVDTS
jgi:hypothetical protein